MARSLKDLPAVHVEILERNIPIEAAIAAFARTGQPAVLESSLRHSQWGRFSIFACDPIDEFVADGSAGGNPFESLFARTQELVAAPRPDLELPFLGGWIGYFTYESCGRTDLWHGAPQSRSNASPVPSARFHLYDSAAIYDHATERWHLVATDLGGRSSSQAGVAQRLQRLRALFEQTVQPSHRLSNNGSQAALLGLGDYHWPADVVLSLSQREYFAAVESALGYITAGDIFQVNLAERFAMQSDLDPLSIYMRLREITPSYYAAFLPWDGQAILSASPELFLQLRSGHVLTRPIKGTRPRGTDIVNDAQLRRELRESEKDAAELAMIVDLLRNDLGRVCSFGSIRVRKTAEIEIHPTVFHSVATIEGQLDPGQNWLELLRATFPGGSVTGAPKVRAMQIVRELEPVPRGVYCGAIGMFSLDGSVTLNLPIRTLVQTGRHVQFHAGGGIVADSTPEGEWREILAKASGMIWAVRGTTQSAPLPFAEVIL